MRLTLDKAYKAGYTQAIVDLIERKAVSWKYTDLPDLGKMIDMAAEVNFELWKAEQSVPQRRSNSNDQTEVDGA